MDDKTLTYLTNRLVEAEKRADVAVGKMLSIYKIARNRMAYWNDTEGMSQLHDELYDELYKNPSSE